MTLLFNRSQIGELNSKIGCIQKSEEPEKYENVSSFLSVCQQCNCPLFPLADERSNQLDCPICHPNSDFSKKTFRFLQAQKKPTIQNHFVFIFDIAMPPPILFTYINSLYNSIDDSDTISIVCVTNNVIFASVINGLLIFDVYEDGNSAKSLDHYIIKKNDISEVVLPSISSIYTLIPAELDFESNPFIAIQYVLQSLQTPSPNTGMVFSPRISYLVFFYRSISRLQASDAESLGTSISESNGIVHFGGPPEFRRYSAISHFTFGSMFATTNHQTKLLESVLTDDLNQVDLIFNTVKDSYCQPSLIPLFVKLSKSHHQLNLYAPRSVTFLKTTGCSGKVVTKEKTAMLDLKSMNGGSIQIQVDPKQLGGNQLRLLEINIRNHLANDKDEQSNNGYYLLTLHTLNKDSGEEDRKITETLILKAFAFDVLRNAWEGKDLSEAINTYLTPEIKEIICNTSLHGLNFEEEAGLLSRIMKPNETFFTPLLLQQMKILRLYYVLLNIGQCDINPKKIEKLDCNIIIAPPVLYVQKKSEEISASVEEILASTTWPFSVLIVDESEFRKLCIYFQVE